MIPAKFTYNYQDGFCYQVNSIIYRELLFNQTLIACLATNYKNIVNHFQYSFYFI